MLLDDAPCGHLVVDDRWRVLRCNHAASTLAGREPSAMVGARLAALFAPPSRLFLQTHVQPTVDAEGAISEIQLVLRSPSGEDLPVMLNAARTRGESGVEVQVILVAMRRRAEYEAALRHAREAADEARRERERTVASLVQARKLESLSQLAGGVAHDFNNLLCAILGNAQLLGATLGAAHPARELLIEIEAAARVAGDLSSQMLAYAGAARLALRPLVLDDALARVQAQWQSPRREGAALIWEFTAQGVMVDGDGAQLRRMVEGLITNALEATAADGPAIRVVTRVRCVEGDELAACHVGGARTPGRYVEVEVADRGHGIAADTRERLFEPFFSTRGVGRGLGLAAAMGIAHAHRGAIRVESAPGMGTTVFVLLPARAEASRRG